MTHLAIATLFVLFTFTWWWLSSTVIEGWSRRRLERHRLLFTWSGQVRATGRPLWRSPPLQLSHFRQSTWVAVMVAGWTLQATALLGLLRWVELGLS
jgi:hypothetical protein